MNGKLFVAVLVGLLAVNASVQSRRLKNDSMKELALAILNQVLNISTTLLDEANQAVDSIEKDPNAVKEKIVGIAANITKDINTLFLNEVDRLADKATAGGKAIIACIDAEKPKVEAEITQISEYIGTCGVAESPKVIAEVRTILGQLGDLKNDVQNQTDTLSNCTDPELVCLAGLFSTISGTVEKVRTAVSSDIQDIIELVKTIAVDVKKCGILDEIRSNAQDIFNEGVVCIKK